MTWIGTWRTGPDAGSSIALAVGTHLVGRAHTAGFRCDDPTLQPHHALIEIVDEVTARFTQLTGRAPICIDGHPIEGTVDVHAGSLVELGASAFLLTDEAATHPPVQVHNGAVVREPRSLSAWQVRELAHPGQPPVRESGGGGLLPALLGLAGAAAIALLLRQPMFLLFGAMGAVVAAGSWSAQRCASTRRLRRATAEFEAALASYEVDLLREHAASRQHVLATVPTIDRSVRTLLYRESSLWNRRANHPDAFLVSIGMGSADVDLPVAADVGGGCRLAVLGPNAVNATRAIVLQLAASCGPADVRFAIVTDHPERWSALRALPHLMLPDGSSAIVSEAELARVLEQSECATHRVLLTDQPALLTTRTSVLRRALGDGAHSALIVVVPTADTAATPHVCNSVLTTTNGSSARWVSDVRRTMLPQHVRLVGVAERMTAQCVAAIRGLIDPEDSLSVAGAIPQALSLAQLMQQRGHSIAPAAIAASWAAAPADPAPRTVIGMAADGIVDVDLVRDGPHGLIAGTTGSGKSEFLRSLIAGMAITTSPAHLTFVLVDYKGGATFDACAALPHVVGMVTDLDEQLADRALRSLHAELRRRELLLRQHCAADLSDLHAHAPSVVLPRLVVVIDEFAALVAERPTFLHALVGVAQRGRSLGVHLLLATQRPSGVITDDVRANTNFRLALRLHDNADAIDVVGIDTPAHLPRGVPGRAVLRLGAGDYLTFQTAHCSADLPVVVRAVCEATKLAGISAPPAPWQPPLPTVLTADELRGCAIGLVDEPDLQRTRPLLWSLDEGHLAVVGSAGSGVTSALLTLADRTLSAQDAVDVYVIDARSDERWREVASHPRCVAVVGVQERERLLRLLHRLSSQTRNLCRTAPRTLLIIDGLDALRRELDDIDSASEFAALEIVLLDAAIAGITIIAAAESAAALPVSFLNRCPARWVLHLNDPHDAALLGVDRKLVPARVPGRIAIAGSGAMSQLVAPRPLSLAHSIPAAGAPIGTVSSRLLPTNLPPPRVLDGVTALCLGVGFSSGEPHMLEIPGGEHVLLAGGARRGRSSGLARIASAWSAAYPDGWIGAILPRRSTFPRQLANCVASDSAKIDALLNEVEVARSAALLVIDDAECVDDADGRIRSLTTRMAGVCIVAAGRPEALRQTYGHWTAALRRSRLGLIATGGGDLDGDLLGASLPRRTPIPARPGLWWVVDNGEVTLVQLALDELIAPNQRADEVAAAAM